MVTQNVDFWPSRALLSVTHNAEACCSDNLEEKMEGMEGGKWRKRL